MELEKRLCSNQEVGQIIRESIHDIVQKMMEREMVASEQRIELMKDWAAERQPKIREMIAEEIVRRHVQGVTFAVWSGPPGSGKGTNIETVNILGKVYAEVASQGVAYVLPEPFHSKLLGFSLSQTVILTGTKGMFNRPEGEYAELFGELNQLVAKAAADGGFVPDEIVSVLVELMILYRLTQNFHKIQIDLWPRTKKQFTDFSELLKVVKVAGGKVSTELVVIKVLDIKSLQMVRENPLVFAQKSRGIAEAIGKELTSKWYIQGYETSSKIEDVTLRFEEEAKALTRLFDVLESSFQGIEEGIVIAELKTVCDRMAFRFKTVVSAGGTPRPDEFPLSIIRRLAVYTGETSPAFLEVVTENNDDLPLYIVSSAGTPEEVIADILETLAGQVSQETRWVEMKKIAGEIAVDVVNRKEPIVEDLERRVGGILSST